ncbi:MAG TPA: aminotransferase class V-fold PLP-dependent enzyme [Kineosporiaceae bacterium]|nr:aminotransferase class V-fold PLP-dependent enzyme [Kineosporiaceae bacterium]
MPRHTFGSDNHAPVHPDVLAALTAVNDGHSFPYGADEVTAAAVDVVRRHLGADAEVAFVFNGTGANLVGLGLALKPWQHVVCATSAHIAVDECGAPERLLGVKLVEIDTPDGKLTPELVEASITGVGDEHRTQPGALSITQSTELGTLYTPDEIRALADVAHARGMILHLDGARLANAAAALGVPLAVTTSDCGVDVLSLGGTKNGLMGAEAVVVLRPDRLGEGLAFARKQLGQLGSKGRYLGAQFLALLEGDLWLRNAAHANAMARRLADAVRGLPDVEITRPVQANAVFALLPPDVVQPLLERFGFYVWDERTGEVRWMCSWDTTEEDVEELVGAVRSAVAVEV